MHGGFSSDFALSEDSVSSAAVVEDACNKRDDNYDFPVLPAETSVLSPQLPSEARVISAQLPAEMSVISAPLPAEMSVISAQLPAATCAIAAQLPAEMSVKSPQRPAEMSVISAQQRRLLEGCSLPVKVSRQASRREEFGTSSFEGLI